MKKLLCLLLVVCLTAVTLAAAIADLPQTTEDGIRYFPDNSGGVVIVGYDGGEADLVIPAEIGGLPVHGIHTMSNCHSLRSIVLPEGLTVIDYAALMNCSSLEEIRLPSTVTYLGKNAFADCRKLKKADLSACTGLVYIAPAVFARCASLEEVLLPDTLAALAGGSFEGCGLLRTVRFVRTNQTALADGQIRYLTDADRMAMAAFLARRATLDSHPEWIIFEDTQADGTPRDPDTFREPMIAELMKQAAVLETKIAEAEAALSDPKTSQAKARALNTKLTGLRTQLEAAKKRIESVRDHAILESEAIAAWERETGLTVTPENDAALYTLWKSSFDPLINDEAVPEGAFNGVQYIKVNMEMSGSSLNHMHRLDTRIFPGADGILCYLPDCEPGIDASAFGTNANVTLYYPAGSPAETMCTASGFPCAAE